MFLSEKEKNFIKFGFLIFCFTNLTLQILLLITTIWISTFTAQCLNLSMGYFFYGKYVFKKKLTKKNLIIYFIFNCIIFFINGKSISYLAIHFDINNNLSAILLIPFLVSLSFLIQKNLVFKK